MSNQIDDRFGVPEVRKEISLYDKDNKKKVRYAIFNDDETVCEITPENFKILYKYMIVFIKEMEAEEKGAEQ